VNERLGAGSKALTIILLVGALVLAVAPAGSGRVDWTERARPTIVIGTKSGAEQSVLGQLYKQALEANGFSVVYKQNVGATAVIDRRLRDATIAMYPEYTGAIVQVLFRREAPKTSKATFELAKDLERGRGLALLAPTPSSSTEAIAVLRATAERYELTTVGDLRRVPGLKVAGTPQLGPANAAVAKLRKGYALTKAKVARTTAAASLAALASGRAEAAIVSSTDPRVARGSRYRLLRDPAHVFAFQNVAPVVNVDLVSQAGRDFTTIVNAVSARLTRKAVVTLNAAVVVNRQSPKAAARAFLRANRLVSSANLFVSERGNDGGANCKRFATAQLTPDAEGRSVCKSFDRAYHLARPGDIVEVAGGNYEAQDLTPKAGAAAPNVVFEPSAAGDVTLADLTTEGSFLTIKNMTVATGANHLRGWKATGGDILLDGVDITGPYARVAIGGTDSSADITWRNSGIGTPGNTIKRVCGLDGGPSGDPEPVEIAPVRGLTFSNLDFYPFLPDMGNPACGADGVMHLETIRVNDGVENFRLERSRFHRGDGSGTARVFVTRLAGANSDNLTVVNNWFGAADGPGGGSTSVHLGHNQSCVNYVFAYNEFEQAFNPDCSPMSSLKLVGNTGVGPSYLCIGTSRIRNLWTWSSKGACGSDTWVLDNNFSLAALKFAPDGYHLLPGSPAINAGETAECMALTGGLDIDGQLRTGVCDAGPDEFRPPR
jgi:osmoprotectant transport system substrate-binding protein